MNSSSNASSTRELTKMQKRKLQKMQNSSSIQSMDNILQVTFDGQDPREQLFKNKMMLTSKEFFKILDDYSYLRQSNNNFTAQSNFETNGSKKQRSMQSLMSIDCNDDLSNQVQISDITFSKEALKQELANAKLQVLDQSPAEKKKSSLDVTQKISILQQSETDGTPVRFSRASSAQFGRISTELEKYSSEGGGAYDDLIIPSLNSSFELNYNKRKPISKPQIKLSKGPSSKMTIRCQSRNDKFQHARTELLRSITSEKKALHLVEKNRELLKNLALMQADNEVINPVSTNQNSDIQDECYGNKKTPKQFQTSFSRRGNLSARLITDQDRHTAKLLDIEPQETLRVRQNAHRFMKLRNFIK